MMERLRTVNARLNGNGTMLFENSYIHDMPMWMPSSLNFFLMWIYLCMLLLRKEWQWLTLCRLFIDFFLVDEKNFCHMRFDVCRMALCIWKAWIVADKLNDINERSFLRIFFLTRLTFYEKLQFWLYLKFSFDRKC